MGFVERFLNKYFDRLTFEGVSKVATFSKYLLWGAVTASAALYLWSGLSMEWVFTNVIVLWSIVSVLSWCLGFLMGYVRGKDDQGKLRAKVSRIVEDIHRGLSPESSPVVGSPPTVN